MMSVTISTRDPMEAETVTVSTRAAAMLVGVPVPVRFAFSVEIARFDGERLPAMAVETAKDVARLLADLWPARVVFKVAADEDAQQIALRIVRSHRRPELAVVEGGLA